MLWPDPPEYALCIRAAARMADAVLGSDEEIAAAVGGVHPERLMKLGPEVIAQKHGPRGVTVHRRGAGSAAVEPHAVEVVNGLGAGDAFAAAFGWRLLRGDSPVDAAGWANRAGAHVAGRLGCSIAMPYQEHLQ